MITKINGVIISASETVNQSEAPIWTLPHIREFIFDTAKQTGEGTVELVDQIGEESLMTLLKPFIYLFEKLIVNGVHLINFYSAEIITVLIVFSGIGIMLSPMTGDGGNKWLGRGLVAFMLGVAWRITL